MEHGEVIINSDEDREMLCSTAQEIRTAGLSDSYEDMGYCQYCGNGGFGRYYTTDTSDTVCEYCVDAAHDSF